MDPKYGAHQQGGWTWHRIQSPYGTYVRNKYIDYHIVHCVHRDLQILRAPPTNAQFYYNVFHSSLAATCFGLIAIITKLTPILLKLTVSKLSYNAYAYRMCIWCYCKDLPIHWCFKICPAINWETPQPAKTEVYAWFCRSHWYLVMSHCVTYNVTYPDISKEKLIC
jgi:hypothetical protein